MIKRIVYLLAWQFVASFAFLLIGGMMTGLPFWLLGPQESLYLGLMFLAYLVSTCDRGGCCYNRRGSKDSQLR